MSVPARADGRARRAGCRSASSRLRDVLREVKGDWLLTVDGFGFLSRAVRSMDDPRGAHAEQSGEQSFDLGRDVQGADHHSSRGGKITSFAPRLRSFRCTDFSTMSRKAPVNGSVFGLGEIDRFPVQVAPEPKSAEPVAGFLFGFFPTQLLTGDDLRADS